LQFQNDEELEWQMLIQENEQIATVRKCRIGKVFVSTKTKKRRARIGMSDDKNLFVKTIYGLKKVEILYD
jgi:hypothetical protein